MVKKTPRGYLKLMRLQRLKAKYLNNENIDKRGL